MLLVFIFLKIYTVNVGKRYYTDPIFNFLKETVLKFKILVKSLIVVAHKLNLHVAFEK